MRTLNISVLIMISIVLISCEKEVYIELPEPEIKFVVEGWIEQDKYPVVAITRSSSYFSPVDSASLFSSYVLNADVYVSDGQITEKLELDMSNAQMGVWPFIYYKGSSIKGELGKTYKLTIVVEGDTITGKTTIPQQIFLDSIWWKPENIHNPGNDSLGYIWGKFTDDPLEKNYFRLFAKRLNRDKTFIPIFGSVFDDTFFTEETYTFSIYRGIQSLTDEDAIMEDKELFYFKKGDTVVTKITSIDKEHYEFWRTIEQEMFTGGNPFVYPVLIRHNVTNALGVWGGYAATYYTLVIGE